MFSIEVKRKTELILLCFERTKSNRCTKGDNEDYSERSRGGVWRE